MKKRSPKIHWQKKIINGEEYAKPFSEEAKQNLSKYKQNQLMHGKMTGETDERSVRQLGLYWQACKFASERIDNPDWSTQKHVDFQLRMELKFFDLDFIFYDDVKKQVSFKLLSIAFENLSHILACNYFDRAYEVLANVIPHDGMYQVDVMIDDIKRSCKGHK